MGVKACRHTHTQSHRGMKTDTNNDFTPHSESDQMTTLTKMNRKQAIYCNILTSDLAYMVKADHNIASHI